MVSAASGLLLLLAVLAFGLRQMEKPEQEAVPVPAQTDGEAAVYFLDVGQGDSIVIRSGTYTMLIDAGERTAGDTIEASLDALGVEKLDAVVATHPHADHIGGMEQIIEAFPIETFYMTVLPDSQTPTTATYERMLDALDAQQVHVERLTTDTVLPAPEGAAFTVLSPRAEDVFEETNDYSAVLRFRYGDVSFLLTGDAETPVEEQLVAEGGDLSADVLKCGHHGSSSSTSASFLRAVGPSVAVISCGVDNSYGHPHTETLETLQAAGCTVLRTDQDGTVAAMTDGRDFTVHTWSPAEGLSPAA